jgi:O-6-methylguanine DNA methyltransferase
VGHFKASDELNDFFEKCHRKLLNYLSGNAKKIRIEVDYSSLSTFQRAVLEVIREIPYGTVSSYKEIGHKMNSKAYQAIGSACGKNPFLILYPCHRVVGTNHFGGFSHGIEMKKDLLRLEGYHWD